MNKDKAIQLLERLQDPEPYEPMLTKDAYDAIQMAVDALSADGDTISRKAAIDVIDSFNVFESRSDQIKLEQMIGELPPVQLGTNLAEVGTDCISRAKAIDALKNDMASLDHIIKGMSANDVRLDAYVSQRIQVNYDIYAIEQLPPAEPERIKGHWIDTNIFFPNTCGQFVHEVYCDKCHGIAYFRRTNDAYVGASICPNCGADMRGVTT